MVAGHLVGAGASASHVTRHLEGVRIDSFRMQEPEDGGWQRLDVAFSEDLTRADVERFVKRLAYALIHPWHPVSSTGLTETSSSSWIGLPCAFGALARMELLRTCLRAGIALFSSATSGKKFERWRCCGDPSCQPLPQSRAEVDATLAHRASREFSHPNTYSDVVRWPGKWTDKPHELFEFLVDSSA